MKVRKKIMKKNTISTKKATKDVISTMATLKRKEAHNFTLENNNSKCFKFIAENETYYLTDDNKLVNKNEFAEKVFDERKNTIDYRFNYDTDSDMKYNQIQKSLCDLLKISRDSDMRILSKLFTLSEITKSIAITITDSTILNRANCFEVMLSEHDYELVKNSELASSELTAKVRKRENRLDIISFDENKYKNRIVKTEAYKDIYSIILQNKEDIKAFNELVNR